jgi:hypothetical protein
VSRLKVLAIALAIGVSIGAAAWGQNPTGTLTGRVSNNEDGTPLPGVTVTATSPNLQGDRSTITGANGDYKLALLPAGTYTVKYELEGMAARDVETKISAAQTTLIDVGMAVAAVSEEIVVTATDAATISETSTAQATFLSEEVSQLAINRNVLDTVNLAAGVSATGPNAATTISGAMSFENLWLVNGVVINENLRGQPFTLFIEDAIQETTVSTAGISAEYGRFTGGVVNVLTKSGGNDFHGSLRSSMTNQDWESDDNQKEFNEAFEAEDEINETYEATIGGRIWRDHIWFFLAARDVETETNELTAQTGIAFPQGREQERYEGKLTINLAASHTLVGSYLEIDDVSTNDFFPAEPLDLNVLNNREDPQDIKSVNYNGVLTSNFFLEGQYSERSWEVAKGAGGPRELYDGTPWTTYFDSTGWHAPNFCGECEQEVRDNENFLAKGSYFLSTEGAGTHDFAFGYDTFKDIRFSVNHQSGSDFTIAADGYFFDAQNNVYPIVTGRSLGWIATWPVFGLDRVQPTDFNTNSYYVNDRWQLNDHWSFNLGVRYDENDGRDAGGNLVTDDSKTSPRLAASYDVKGDGDLVFNASYGTYVAAIANGLGDQAATGGAIGLSVLPYRGAAINPNGEACLATNTCINSDQATHMVVDWWLGFTGFNPLTDNPNEIAGIPDPFGALVLPAEISNQIVPESIQSPAANDYTVGVTKRLGNKGLLRGDLIYREWDDFYSNRVVPNNTIIIEGSELDLNEIGNFGNAELEREYSALQSSFRYRVTNRLLTAATYTLSELEGNVNGETGPNGPISTDPNDHAEYKEARWNLPVGDLGADQRHKLRAWAIYDLLQGERHNLSVSLLESFFSGTPYNASANIDPSPYVDNPGYANPLGQAGYFFSARDAYRTDDITRTDIALNYSFTIGKGFEIFIQPEVLNVFDENGVIDLNTAVNAGEGVACDNGPGGECATFNPFTETPIEGVHWQKGDSFGQPTNADDYQLPRTFRFSVGFRF